MTETNAETNSKSEGKSNRGRDPRSLLDIMRSRAYIYELIRRTNVRSVNALIEAVFSVEYDPKNPNSKATSYDPGFNKHMKGGRTVSDQLINQVSQKEHLASARFVFEIGPEENGTNVPMWRLFEDQFDEFDAIIEMGLALSKQGSDIGLSRVDRVAQLFLPTDQWRELRMDSAVADGENLTEASYEAGYFTRDLRRLSAAIACWRLCLQGADDWGPMEALLDWLLIGPYAQVLADLGISLEMRDLLRMIAADHHARQGSATAAARAFTRFGLDVDVNGKRADRFG